MWLSERALDTKLESGMAPATSKHWPNKKPRERSPGHYRLEVLLLPGSPIHADQDSGGGEFGVKVTAETTDARWVRID